MIYPLILAILFFASPAWAATCNATTWAGIQTCHDGATDGDTITVASGAITASSAVAITKYVKIIGAGIGNTIVTNNYAAATLLTIAESSAGNTRLEGIEFRAGTGPPGNAFYVNVSGSAKPVLITANRFQTNGGSAGSQDAMRFQVNRGVVWLNQFKSVPGVVGGTCLNQASAVRHKPSGAVWNTPVLWGNLDTTGENWLYIENNTFDTTMQGIDVDDSARTVFRYNTATNSAIGTHGVDTSAVGGRAMEVYNNTFIYDQTNQGSGGTGNCGALGDGFPATVETFVSWRGGTGVAHDNVLPNPTSAAWGTKYAVRSWYENLRRNAGSFPCWANAGSTIYPAPRAPGWGCTHSVCDSGSGATQAGTSGVYQDLEPIYLWNNTGGGNYDTPTVQDFNGNECGGSAGTATTYIQIGREFEVATTKPSYTPYTYPHPLTTLTGGGATPGTTVGGGVKVGGGVTIK